MRIMQREPISSADPEDMYRQIVEYSFETTVIHADYKVLYINQSGADFLKTTKEDIIGVNILELFKEGYPREQIRERIRQNQEESVVGELIDTQLFKLDGTLVDVELYCHPVMFGDQIATQSIIRDISGRVETQRQLNEMSSEMIEVSSPIVPISEGIAIMPLVGNFDGEKVIHLLDIIPLKLEKHQLDYLIMDFSGIYKMNENVVDFLFKINSILQLLGIKPVLTGIRAELAQKAVLIGKDMSKIRTIRNVKEALEQLKA